MITRIEIDGFKSLRNFALDLDPFTVLVGPNSAGKSNILDALALLSRLASMPIFEAFKQGRGKSIDQFHRHGAETARSLRFAVEVLVFGDYPPPRPAQNGKDVFQSRFRYELTVERRSLRAGAEKLIVGDERLHAMRREDDPWIPAHPEFVAYAGYEHGGADCFFTLRGDRETKGQLVVLPPYDYQAGEELEIALTYTALAKLYHQDVVTVSETLAMCRLIQLGAAHLGDSSERVDSGELSPDASNLPTVLAELPPAVLGEVRADLVALVPGLASFDVTPEGDEIRLDFELSGGDRLPARLVSAGTLHVLALLTALRMKPRPSLLCMEEPENGIYPGRLRALLDLLREATTRRHEDEARELLEEEMKRDSSASSIVTNQLPTQVLLTSHSPVVLAALRSRPQHLRFIDMVRRNGERLTRARTVGKPAAGDPGRLTISPREIDVLLDSTRVEEPA